MIKVTVIVIISAYFKTLYYRQHLTKIQQHTTEVH